MMKEEERPGGAVADVLHPFIIVNENPVTCEESRAFMTLPFVTVVHNNVFHKLLLLEIEI